MNFKQLIINTFTDSVQCCIESSGTQITVFPNQNDRLISKSFSINAQSEFLDYISTICVLTEAQISELFPKTQFAVDVEDTPQVVSDKIANFAIPLEASSEPLIKTDNTKPLYSGFRQDGICMRVIEDKICIYDIFGDELSPIKASIATKDIFSPKTRNDIFKFIRSVSDKTIFPNEDIHKHIDNFFAFHQKFLKLNGNTSELKKLKQDADIKKQLEQSQLSWENFEKDRPKDLLDLIEGKIIGKTKEGKNLREMSTWEKLFDTYSYNNSEYAKIMIHILIGQQIRQARLERLGISLDPRMSCLLFSPSGSGKSAGFNLVFDVAKILNLKVSRVASATDAAMVGSIELVEDEETGKMVPTEIKGILDYTVSDIIYWQEPANLFEQSKNQHEGSTKSYIQSGLNQIEDSESTVPRKMKHGTVEAKCEASLIMVSVPVSSITDAVIDSGFMQRFLFLCRIVDIQDRASAATIDINSYTTMDEEGNINRKNKINQTKLKEDVIKKLQYLKIWIERNKEFVVRDDASKYFLIEEIKYFNYIKNLKNVTERAKDKIATFQQFTIRKGWQIAMTRAALRFSTIVEKEDIMYACEEIITPQMESIQQYLEESWINEIKGKQETSEEEIIKQKIWEYRGGNIATKVSKAEFLEVMSKTLQKSIETVYRRFKKYKLKGLITETPDGYVYFADEATKILRESLKPQPLINL